MFTLKSVARQGGKAYLAFGQRLPGAITAGEPESEENRTNNPLNYWLDHSFIVFVVWLDLGLPNGVLQRYGVSLTTPVGEPEHREADYVTNLIFRLIAISGAQNGV